MDDKLRQRLDLRICNQRARLRFWEKLKGQGDWHWRMSALSYRKQLIEAGIKPRIDEVTIRKCHKLKKLQEARAL